MKAHLVGGGISSLSAAAFLIKDGGLLGANIHVYEAGEALGGALDASGSAETGYSMRGGRMFEAEDRCVHYLMSFIPSAADPTKSIDEEMRTYHADYGWNDKARLVAGGGRVLDATKFGLGQRNRLDLLQLAATPEALLEGKTIADCLDLSILATNFWYMFGSIFAFMPWHSAIEMRRYLLRFIHLVPTMASMTTIQRTRLNQYEALVLPLANWLRRLGVQFHLLTHVTGIDFASTDAGFAATALRLVDTAGARRVEVSPEEFVFVTNGSQVAGSTRGSMETPPPATAPQDASWQLWENLAQGRADFGRPAAFNSDPAKSAWITFTLTTRSALFVDLMATLTGSQQGRGGLITLTDSNWLLTIVGMHNPHFAGQPPDVHIWWGYGLYLDRPGNFVPKLMPACSGAEIVTEVLHHLGFAEHIGRILADSICIPCLLPYAGSCLLLRRSGDRPRVVPKGSANFAFIGEFAEIPDEVIFTTEYAVRTARTAVAALLNLDPPPPVYKGQLDPKVLIEAAKAILH